MADQKIQLTVQVNAETGQLEVLGAKFDQVSGKVKGTSESFSSLTKGAGSLLQSFLPFLSAGAVVAFFASAVKGAEEQNESFRRLKFTLEGAGIEWSKNEEAIRKWTNTIAASTRFSDGEAIDALDKLTRVTGSHKQAMLASELAMNMSVASGKSLATTTETVTNLLNGNERAIIQVKREFGNLVSGAETTQDVLDKLSSKLKNAAKDEDSLTKQKSILTHQFEEFKDTIGNKVIPVVSSFLDFILNIKTHIMNLGINVAGEFKKITIAFGGFQIALDRLKQGDVASLGKVYDATMNAMARVTEQTNAKIIENLKHRTDIEKEIDAQSANDKLLQTKDAQAKLDAEKAQKDAEELQKKQEQASKIASIESELQQKMASLPNQTLPTKIAALNAETEARRKKIQMEIKDEVAKQKLLDQLNKYELKQTQVLSNEEYMVKATVAFNIANLAIQTLQTVNAMGERGSEAERVRAKALLALQQSIAIGWAWVNAMKVGGPFAVGLAAATTALLTAQFAQGVQNIDRAGKAEKIGMEGININAPVPGINPGPNPGSGDGVSFIPAGGGGGGGGAISGGGGGGGQSLQFVITFNGDIIVTGVNGATDIADRMVDVIGEKLIERIKGMGQISFTGVG